MKKAEKIALFRERFINRSDIYAIQPADQSGKCGYRLVSEKLTDQLIHQHLDGKITLGGYAAANRTTKYVVVDIDNRDEKPVKELLSITKREGVAAYVESSGRKGYHLWLWFDEPTACETAVEVGKRVLARGSDPILRRAELFPGFKPENKVGSLIKLPLGVHRATGQRCLFLNEDFQPFEDQWSFLQSIRENSVHELLRRLPALPKENHRESSSHHGSRRAQTLTSRETSSGRLPRPIKPCVLKIMENGSDEGERNKACHIIATECRANGQDREQALETVRPWYEKNRSRTHEFTWQEVKSIVNTVYSSPKVKTYGCGSPTNPRKPLLDRYCRSQDRTKGDPGCDYYAAFKTGRKRNVEEITAEEIEMDFINSGWQFCLTQAQNVMYRLTLPRLEAIKGVRPGRWLLTDYRELRRWTGLKSGNGVTKTIDGLERSGLVEVERGNWGKVQKPTRIRRIIPFPEPPREKLERALVELRSCQTRTKFDISTLCGREESAALPGKNP